MTGRLAVVSDAVYPWNTGGKEMRHHELLTRLARHGWDVHLYTMHWWEGAARTHVADGLTYHALCRRLPLYSGTRRSVRQAVIFALATLRMLFVRFDVVEVDAIPFLQLFPMRIVTWLRRRPMVVTWHEFWGRDYWVAYLGPAGRLAALLERTAIRLPDRLVVASEGTAARLRAQVPGRAAVRVVPNGVDADDLADVRPRPGGDELIVVGRLLANKNVDVAIGATRLLRERGHDVRLRVVGEGPEHERLRRQAADAGLGDVVRMDGFVDDRGELLAAIAGARVLLFPSVREGFGMVALEALALGTPVVTSDHPDNFARHLIADGHTGRVCAATPEAVAEATETVLTAGDAWRANARLASQGYDWDALARDVAEVYAR